MNMEEKIILVADDDLDDQEMLEEVFLGIEKDALIHTVSSAKEALEYLRNCVPTALPCLIILDYNMPDLTGAQLTEMIAQNKLYKHIPILVWSTSNSSVYKQECEEKGAKHYFYKPYDYIEVVEMAKQMLSYCGENARKVKTN